MVPPELPNCLKRDAPDSDGDDGRNAESQSQLKRLKETKDEESLPPFGVVQVRMTVKVQSWSL